MTDYYYDASWRVIEERSGESVENQYVYGAFWAEVPVLRIKGTECLFYATDATGKVTSLVSSSGQVVERYVYDPYGKVTVYNSGWTAQVAWTASRRNEILYSGYLRDVIGRISDHPANRLEELLPDQWKLAHLPPSPDPSAAARQA